MRRIFKLALITTCLLAATSAAIVATVDKGLPNDTQMSILLSNCQFTRYRGREWTSCPHKLTYAQFSDKLALALVAAEDKSFFEHGGYSPRAVLRAASTVLNRRVQGGSTITQQLARILLLDSNDKFLRKIPEILTAIRIERLLTKKEILARYMNTVPLSQNLFGFDEAARFFFGVTAAELELSEAVILVGMLPAPGLRDPEDHPNECVAAAANVLKKMREQGKITHAIELHTLAIIKSKIIGGKLKRGRAVWTYVEYGHYRELVFRDLAAQKLSTEANYRIVVPVDATLQAEATAATATLAASHQAAAAFLRPTGEVLAIVGSRDYNESPFNRAYKAVRSTGSTIKPFIRAVSIDKGYAGLRKANTAPLDIENDWPAENDARCRGSVTYAQAITFSCNRPFAHAAVQNEKELRTLLINLGLQAPTNPALAAIGGVETSPLALARAYTAIANHGELFEHKTVLLMLDGRGKVSYQSNIKSPAKRVMRARVADELLRELRGPVKEGTATAANSSSAMVYGKTGTTSSNYDAWFAGITHDFVGVFWTGHDTPTQMNGVYGGGGPSRAFRRVVDTYYATPKRLVENVQQRS